MRNLAEDLDEVSDPKRKAWVRRRRADACLGREQATCWFAEVESGPLGADYETWGIFMGSSPGDVLFWAEAHAEGVGYARREGLGSWILEVHGDGENRPTRLRVVPHWDEGLEGDE